MDVSFSPRMSNAQQKKRKRTAGICCPSCGFHRLIDRQPETNYQTFSPGDSGYDTAQLYTKCFKCKQEIGITIL